MAARGKRKRSTFRRGTGRSVRPMTLPPFHDGEGASIARRLLQKLGAFA